MTWTLRPDWRLRQSRPSGHRPRSPPQPRLARRSGCSSHGLKYEPGRLLAASAAGWPEPLPAPRCPLRDNCGPADLAYLSALPPGHPAMGQRGWAVLVLIAAWGLFAVLVAIVFWPRLRPAGADMPRANVDTGPVDSGGSSALARRLAYAVGPTALALLLALLSLPLVALSLGVTPGAARENEALSASDFGRWSAAASATCISALVAGTIGAPAVRRHARIGALFTFTLALLVAVPALPLLPVLLGQSVGAGFVCIGACSDVTSTRNLMAGVWADLFFPGALFLEPVPVLTLAVGVGLWTRLVRRSAEA